MGWWSPAVLGGDEPLDILDDLTRQIGIYGGGQWFNQSQQTRDKIRTFGVLGFLAFIDAHPPEQKRTAAQIVGLLHVASATPLPMELKYKCLWGCATGHLNWKHDASQRQKHLQDLSAMITLYAHNPSFQVPRAQLEKMLGV